ncbi:hypothetical protein BDQ12DRAFT_645786 [Crucibulum laeve]|uniref:N-acetyltransferase domain-containing protein n=1 Tax=Crucibulum laeve TaxID=68775 RepID=A0A5C3MEE1_9AGAR|nr:hypothetical protein BDQ12DRAFT_645786 [Crucibulum laeve]
MAEVIIQHIEHPSEAQINASVALFVDLMKDDNAALSLSGGDLSLVDPMARAILLAGAIDGEYYSATNEEGELVGFTMWMPPGQELFSTEEQRNLAAKIFMAQLSDGGKEYYKTTYTAEFPSFVATKLGSTAKVDSWWLHMAMVRRDYQRKGVARALISPILTKAREKGETLALCTTSDRNVPIYVALGFTLKGSKIMPSPWGEWPLYVFALDTRLPDYSTMQNSDIEEESTALLPGSGYEKQSERDPTTSRSLPLTRYGLSPTCLAICAFMLFIAVDIAAYVYVARTIADFSITSTTDVMEFRDPYIGLDELYSLGKVKPSQYQHFINAPRLSVQISRSEPEKVFPDDVHRWPSDFGQLSPPDRHLLVTPSVHTIAQFSVLDYGMEKCALAMRLPARDEVLLQKYSVEDANGIVRLNVCQLEGSRPLDVRTLSWTNRPRCVQSMGIVEARMGEEVEAEPFDCRSGSFLAFEISCADENNACGVDVWSNHNDTWGVFINQYQTLL